VVKVTKDYCILGIHAKVFNEQLMGPQGLQAEYAFVLRNARKMKDIMGLNVHFISFNLSSSSLILGNLPLTILQFCRSRLERLF
jgi:hypothetical protein